MSKDLSNLLTEMVSFVSGITPEEIAKAKAKVLKPTELKNLHQLQREWAEGAYDEDPETVVSELRHYIN